MSASRTDSARTSARSLPNVIAIASGKGGVGKTSISVNLGVSLAKTGKRVCVFDADTGLANVNILLGLAPQFTLEHVLFGAKSIEDVLLSGPYGLKVIPGANGISECVTLHPRQQMRLTRELTRIESEFDYLILDTAAGIADSTLDFASAAHQTIIVITPEPTSLTDAFSMVKLLHRRRQIERFQIIVNMANSATQAREVFHRFNAAVEKYVGAPTHLLGFLLLDESLRNAVSLQHPVALFPDTDPSSRSFIRLADAVQQCVEQQSDAPTTSFADFWQRQFREQAERESSGVDDRSESGRSYRKPRRAPAAAPGDNVEGYIGELKARLLLLLENPSTPSAPLADLLNSVGATFQRRFDVAIAEGSLDKSFVDGKNPIENAAVDDKSIKRNPAVDVWIGLQELIANAERDAGPLHELADRLQPWATVKPEPKPFADRPEPPLATMNVDIAEVPLAAGTSKRPRVVSVPPVHRYNENRFGSQPALLELLRRQADSGKSALELIDILR